MKPVIARRAVLAVASALCWGVVLVAMPAQAQTVLKWAHVY